jgi:hypothetical protein
MSQLPATSCVEYYLLARVEPGNPYRSGRLSTVGLLVKITCFVKKKKYFFLVFKGAELNLLVEGGQLY